jgi:hypothetical protein
MREREQRKRERARLTSGSAQKFKSIQTNSISIQT